MEPLAFQPQRCRDTEGYDSYRSQRHSGALAERHNVEQNPAVERRPEGGVKELQQHERGAQAGQPIRGGLGPLGWTHPADAGVQRAVEAQAEAQQGPGVPEEAGQWTGVHADPLGSLAPAQRLLHTPEQVDAHQLEEQVEQEGEGEEERRGQQVRVQVGCVDLLGSAQGFGHQDTWEGVGRFEDKFVPLVELALHITANCQQVVFFLFKEELLSKLQ